MNKLDYIQGLIIEGQHGRSVSADCICRDMLRLSKEISEGSCEPWVSPGTADSVHEDPWEDGAMTGAAWAPHATGVAHKLAKVIRWAFDTGKSPWEKLSKRPDGLWDIKYMP